jgi:1,4-alpha-glucan branching enzyme
MDTTISCHAPQASSVFVAGTFNDWHPEATPLQRDAEGNWSVTVPLAPGRYEFKFFVDGQWCIEPGSDPDFDGRPGCCANEFGRMNRILEVT